MPGFGSKKFGSGAAGEWAWSTGQLWDNLPDIYKEQDVETGNGKLQALLESVAPTMDTLRRKIRDLSDLKDPLIAPTNHTFNESITIIGVDDLGNGTSRVFISQGVNGDKYNSVKPGYTLVDYSGTKFAIIEVHSAALVTDVPVAPVDPVLIPPNDKTGKHVIVENIALGTSTLIPLVSGTAITGEVPVTLPINNGINAGPYTFTLSAIPAKNIVTIYWTSGGTNYYGQFNNTGLISGNFKIGSSINFVSGAINLNIGYGKIADIGSIRVDYTTTTVPVTDPSSITADNLLAFLGSDLGAVIDRHDSDALQRSFVYHSFQLWDLKGTYDGYYYMGRISGYIVDAKSLYKVSLAIYNGLPDDHRFEIPSGSGHYYTDIAPGILRYDEVAADAIPTDIYDFDSSFPSVDQNVTVTTVTTIGMEGTRTRYKVTVTTTTGYVPPVQMYKSFNTLSKFKDDTLRIYVMEKFTKTSTSTYTFEVVDTVAPAIGGTNAKVTWQVFKATVNDPDLTIIVPEIEEIGLQYAGATGKRYAITHDFMVDLPIVGLGSWALIDSDGVISYLESFELVSVTTYRFEFVSPTYPAVGRADIFYLPSVSTSCEYCAASVLRIMITPAEALLDPVSMSEDSLGRLITRLEQMIPAHIRAVDYVYSIGPSIATWGITSSSVLTTTTESPVGMGDFFDTVPLDVHPLDSAIFASSATTDFTTLNVLEEYLVGVDPILFGGWTATGLWHVTRYRSSTQFKSFNYGYNDVGTLGDVGAVAPDYNTGAATTGSLTSPVITAIAAATSVNLRFRQFAALESGVIKDLPTVYVKSSPANAVLTSFNKTALSLNVTGNTGGLFVTITKDIKAAVVGAGNFYLEFAFDSVDNLNNSTEGWYIDDVEVQVVP